MDRQTTRIACFAGMLITACSAGGRPNWDSDALKFPDPWDMQSDAGLADLAQSESLDFDVSGSVLTTSSPCLGEAAFNWARAGGQVVLVGTKGTLAAACSGAAASNQSRYIQCAGGFSITPTPVQKAFLERNQDKTLTMEVAMSLSGLEQSFSSNAIRYKPNVKITQDGGRLTLLDVKVDQPAATKSLSVDFSQTEWKIQFELDNNCSYDADTRNQANSEFKDMILSIRPFSLKATPK